MPWVSLSGKKYSHEALNQLDAGSFENEFEKSALQFCQAWLKGQQEFTIQTSGSTGKPKLISMSRSQMEKSARQTIAALQLSPSETALVCLDTKYIAGQMMLVRCLLSGMNGVVVEPSANPFAGVREKIDFVALVPYQLENIAGHDPGQLNRVRCAIIGGAAIGSALKAKLKGCSCALYATYGMTETISHIALQHLNGAGANDYFTAFENVHLSLDNRGCLCIHADYLDGEIITNDLVEMTDARHFRWLGRADNVINSGGVKVIPEKTEAVMEEILVSLQINTRFFIAGIPDEKLSAKVIAVLEGSPLNPPMEHKIISAAGLRLSKYELPKKFAYLRQFAETPTGKINRSATIALIELHEG